MQPITDEHGYYQTPVRRVFFLARWLPSLFYYPQFIYQILKYSRLAQQGKFGAQEWQQSSQRSTLALETVGVEFEITGVDNDPSGCTNRQTAAINNGMGNTDEFYGKGAELNKLAGAHKV